ncbi:hypothetical protein [Ectobacillus panaciterrae]|uniref:hypothetical protein n=1 Tax=Ectobacillus panaciterrae TaxID=363872 RepID=UPI000421F76E|nr:hypothetical protein [Ectobacillus panaciterrae]
MLLNEKALSWNETMKQLQHKYVGRTVIDRGRFEQSELLLFLHNHDYICLPTIIQGLSEERFASYSVYTTEEKDRKVGTLILEYRQDQEQSLVVDELYFV